MKRLICLIALCFLLPLFTHAQSVDLLWQGETYTPPFYKGRSLWSKQSSATFVAIPQGLGNSAALNYKWSKNGTVLGTLSGVGKNSIVIADSVLSKGITLKVQVVSSGNNVLGEASVNLAPQNPQVIIYENHPLYGFLFNLETYEGYPISNEATFASFPLFFDSPSRQSSVLDYAWKTNSEASHKESSVTYRSPEGGAGTAMVNSSVSHNDKFLEKAERNFSIKFENRE